MEKVAGSVDPGRRCSSTVMVKKKVAVNIPRAFHLPSADPPPVCLSVCVCVVTAAVLPFLLIIHHKLFSSPLSAAAAVHLSSSLSTTCPFSVVSITTYCFGEGPGSLSNWV